jgi:hypothetical protein
MNTPTTDRPEPYAVHGGLAAYRFGDGGPVLLMPGPYRVVSGSEETELCPALGRARYRR